MSGFIDTSVIVRYLTGEPVELAEKAASIIDHAQELWITDVVLAETAYVLASCYQVPREVVVDHLVDFIRRDNLRLLNLKEEFVVEALWLCRPSAKVSFADALLWAAACSAGAKTIYSFDRNFPSQAVEILERLE